MPPSPYDSLVMMLNERLVDFFSMSVFVLLVNMDTWSVSFDWHD